MRGDAFVGGNSVFERDIYLSRHLGRCCLFRLATKQVLIVHALFVQVISSGCCAMSGFNDEFVVLPT